MNQAVKEEMAFLELKTNIVKLMFEFTEKYGTEGDNCLYPQVGNILVDVLGACLSEAQLLLNKSTIFVIKLAIT